MRGPTTEDRPGGGPLRWGVAVPRPFFLTRRTLWVLLSGGAFFWALREAGVFGGDLVNEGGWLLALRFFGAAFHPELAPEFLGLVFDAALVTLAFAVCGTLLSLGIGVLGGVLASERWWECVVSSRPGLAGPARASRLPWLTARGLLAFPRAIHEIVWGLFFVSIVGLDPLVGILAIAIPYGAITAKVFSEILDEAPSRSLDALRASGVGPLKAFLYALVPQAFSDLLSYALYRFECSIRSAAVLGIIGAGGLGYEIFLSLQSLRYEQMWTFLLALILLTGLADFWSTALRRRLGSTHRIDLNLGRMSRERRGGLPRPGLVKVSLVGAVFLVIFSFWSLGAEFGQLFAPRTAELFTGLVAEAVPPSLGGLTLTGLLDISAKTLAMSILAMGLAALGGMLLAFPAANNFFLPGGILGGGGKRRAGLVGGLAVFTLTRGFLLVCRAVPAPIWALLFLFVLFPGILPGAVALGVYTLGVMGRLMGEVTENLDGRPLRALKAQGASGLQVFLYGVLPETMPRFTAYTLYRWEVCIRATAMVGLVGAGGLGRLLMEQLSNFDYSAITTTLLFYVGLTFLVDLLSAAVRRDLR